MTAPSRPIARRLLGSLAAVLLVGMTVAAVPPVFAQASPGVPPISKDACPATHPIKGNHAGRQEERLVDPIYHTAESRWYVVTDPEECFAAVPDAEAAGYRAPRR
jgi:hypothetical protein